VPARRTESCPKKKHGEVAKTIIKRTAKIKTNRGRKGGEKDRSMVLGLKLGLVAPGVDGARRGSPYGIVAFHVP